MKIHCNCCGKEYEKKGDILMEGVASVTIDWGYFSQKDGEIHTFSLCETCYDKIAGSFQIPVAVMEKTELV